MTRRRLGAIDLFVLLLAVASATVVLVLLFTDPGVAVAQRLRLTEYVLIGLFALEFLLALVRHDHRVAYAVRNWYELLALVPVTNPTVASWPLHTLLAVLVVLARFGRVIDRLYGDEAFYRLVDRVRDAAVEWISDAVTVRVLDETLAVLDKGQFTANLAAALDAHGDEVQETVVEKVKADPAFRRLAAVPFVDDLAAFVGVVARRIAVETLRDERTDRLVKQVVRDNVRQIRAEVLKREALTRLA